MAVNGTLKGDNEEIRRLNEELLEIKEVLLSISDKGVKHESYILDFEEFELDILFSENKSRAKISISDGIISILIGQNTVRVNSDGTVIQ